MIYIYQKIILQLNKNHSIINDNNIMLTYLINHYVIFLF
jgi:hypothetical protein